VSLPHFLRRRKKLNPTFPRIAILTPIKEVEDQAKAYFRRLLNLTFPHENISIGLLESDSRDKTYPAFSQQASRVKSQFRAVEVWQRHFHYKIPPGVPRWEPRIQVERRSILARSRNHLLFQGIGDADWVLWLDADVVEFPPDIIQRLLAFGKDIVHPHCVKCYGGPTFDLNAWTDCGRKHLQDHRGGPELVELTTVGGTLLLVRADCHRDGLIFPPYPYGAGSLMGRIHDGQAVSAGEIETEGFGFMAADMQLKCWGVPDLEIIHRDH